MVEGGKSVLEVLSSGFEVIELYATESFYQLNEGIFRSSHAQVEIATESQLTQASSLQTNNAALAIVKIPSGEFVAPADDKFSLVLDDVRDPGNLGTIIRIADWYGIESIYCSHETTDAFAPKVVQACMGSLTRVKVFYADLTGLLRDVELPVYAAVLDGKNIYEERFGKPGLLLMGNESRGVSPQLRALVTHAITIPAFGGAESLNVAVATAVVCDNMKRSQR